MKYRRGSDNIVDNIVADVHSRRDEEVTEGMKIKGITVVEPAWLAAISLGHGNEFKFL